MGWRAICFLLVGVVFTFGVLLSLVLLLAFAGLESSLVIWLATMAVAYFFELDESGGIDFDDRFETYVPDTRGEE